jgi:hypothetical protein
VQSEELSRRLLQLRLHRDRHLHLAVLWLGHASELLPSTHFEKDVVRPLQSLDLDLPMGHEPSTCEPRVSLYYRYRTSHYEHSCMDISPKLPGVEMNLMRKAVLVNASIAIGLIIMYFRGSGIIPIAITGVFLLVLANVLMAVTTSKNRGH